MNDSVKKRLIISNILAFIAIVLLLGTYTLKPVFEYRDPTAIDEEDAIEENESFQPFSFLIPEDTESYEHSNKELRVLMGRVYEYHPTGFYAYLIGYKTMPVWRVSLEAPQYPKASFPHGIPVYFNLTDWSGKVNEMNTINHYIGMNPMESGAIQIRKMIPFIYLLFLSCSLFIYFIKDLGGGCWDLYHRHYPGFILLCTASGCTGLGIICIPGEPLRLNLLCPRSLVTGKLPSLQLTPTQPLGSIFY